MPAVCQQYGVSDPYDAKQNILGGAKVIKDLMSKFPNDLRKAVAAYNCGPGAVDKGSPDSSWWKYADKVLGYYGSGSGSVAVQYSEDADPYEMIRYSQTRGITYDKNTGNEEGYENKTTATANREKNSSALFKNDNYIEEWMQHTLMAEYTCASPLDFIRFVLSQHGVDAGNTMADLTKKTGITVNSLQVGDILIYRPDTSSCDSLAELSIRLNNCEDTDEEEEVEEDYMSLVPMIYVGNNNFTAYSKNLLLSEDNYEDSHAKVRTYKLSKLKKENIQKIVRLKGFTKNSIYGSNYFFEGWTDDNIADFIGKTYSEVWVTKKVKGYDAEGNETEEDFYSAYEEDSFNVPD